MALTAAGACASAGQPNPNSGDDAIDGETPDANVTPDACPDSDNDGACNAADKCPGSDDLVDADADTVADGCDRCPMEDDRIDVNANMVSDCFEAVTLTIPLKVVSGNLWRGWHASTPGDHRSSNENTITGQNLTTFYNSYYVFTMAGFSASSIHRLTLQLQLEQYAGDATEMFTVWDVSTPAATVESSTGDTNLFNDLQSGTSYGTATVSAAQLTQLVSVPLNAAAATAAMAKLTATDKDFVVGVHVDTPPGWIRFGHTGPDATPTTIQLVVKYLP